ncbi:MAG: hypothetical protein DRP15_00035 [Candidatus Aenigmatarchaeota archaeon]|nr:MAG: hypothetical protein DRP15_00035 [Candidatus Aenigmarchaeota archaeon]
MFQRVFTLIAVFALFYGVISAIVLDLVLLLSQPNMENFQKLVVDLGKTIFNSQEVIKESVTELDEVIDDESVAMQYKAFLFNRIIAGCLLSIVILYFIYRGISFFVPSVSGDLGAKLLVLVITFLIFYGCTLSYLILVEHKGLVMPFHGFVELVRKAEAVRTYLTATYNLTPTL